MVSAGCDGDNYRRRRACRVGGAQSEAKTIDDQDPFDDVFAAPTFRIPLLFSGLRRFVFSVCSDAGGASVCTTTGITLICRWTWKLDSNNIALFAYYSNFVLIKWFKTWIRHFRQLIAKFHYTGPTGPDQTKSADFVGDPGLRPGSRKKVRAGPRGSARVRSGPVGPV